jgi:hypothetical protein
MHPVIQKTFGGLTRQYYTRQLFFSFLILAFFAWFLFHAGHASQQPAKALIFAAFGIVSALLYPYARFVYESIVRFITGNNVFFGSAPVMLLATGFTMALCWCFAIFIAPIGLGYLYYRNR